ncbi:class I SAM-dependent methyltransferase [Micromonospora endolithica]|uniref:Class I SAM-dependent methyltransferase n=1 Tax=Micromonospora endolithica TaxID=230091 RepID=A0A3A9YSD8_9ACTN|nr:class I SAM-dependent methyltransferase [Micromonospora endolithica]RKN38885.1 class I SAM-dependent methyltransferase [Micromonospora endolithica]TWJ25510.1 methyltransferase family protein [Micromonospora endolithica]
MARQLDPYALLADVYDRLSRVESKEIAAEYLVRRLKGLHPGRTISVVDLACGSGNVTTALLRHENVTVTAVDTSASMLAIAEAKAQRLNQAVSFVHSDIRQLDLATPHDGAVCLSFSLAYLAEKADLLQFIRRLGANIRRGGLFLFDMIDRSALRSDWFDIEAKRWQSVGLSARVEWTDRAAGAYRIEYSRDDLQHGRVFEHHHGRAYLESELVTAFTSESYFTIVPLSALATSCATPHLRYFLAQRT